MLTLEEIPDAVLALADIAGPAAAELRDSADTLSAAADRVAELNADTPASAPPGIAAAVLLGVSDAAVASAIGTTPAIARAYRQGITPLAVGDSMLLCWVCAAWSNELELQVRTRGDAAGTVAALHIAAARLLLAEQNQRNDRIAAAADFASVAQRWDALRPMLATLFELSAEDATPMH